MKSKWKLFALINYILVLSISSPLLAANEINSEIETESTIKEASIIVKGMACHGCERAIEITLKKVEGIKTVKASHKKERVLVSYDSSLIHIDEIVKSIKQFGYGVFLP